MSTVGAEAVERGALEAGRHHGPSAFGDDLRRFVNLTVTLAITDFKLRYFGSVLGYLWSLVRPLLFFGVIYVVFADILKTSKGVPHYPVYLLTAIVMWTFFTEATTNSVQSLIAREGLLRKMRFPRLTIPLSVSLTALFNLCTNSVVVVVFAVVSGVSPRLSWLGMPLLVLVLAFLAVGTSMLLSALYVRFRDVLPIWEVLAQVLFYGSPIFYIAAKYQAAVAKYHFDVPKIAMANPLAMVFTEMGHIFVDPSIHSAATYSGGSIELLVPIGITIAVFIIGLWVFSREAPRIAERL